MPDNDTNSQLPLRTTTNTRPRKWSTIGGRATSSSTTVIPTNETDAVENTSKPDSQHRRSTSLLRKLSTLSRTSEKPVISSENPEQPLKKSRSLMNVLRSKFNSPAVLRRFRSKSRESTKQTVTEVNEQTSNEQTIPRKSRKRDSSPIKRFTSCVSQKARHQRAQSNERQQQLPEKSITNDTNLEIKDKPLPIHNQEEVKHINACYDEIRAKYFHSHDIKKSQTSNDEIEKQSAITATINDSLFSNELLNDSQYVSVASTHQDPLLEARKQSNIKLNCMLSGYTLTKSFANYERSFGQNDLFKYHHYYDVGKRKYDWNFTNTTSRLYSTLRTKPISKSIDSIRPTNGNDLEKSRPVQVEKFNVINNDSLDLLLQQDNDQDIEKQLPYVNELVILEDSDLIKLQEQKSEHSSNVHATSSVPVDVDNTFVSTSSALSDKINTISSHEQDIEETDEEFERNFMRAVNRALGVVNKDSSFLTQTAEDIPCKPDEPQLNLTEVTEEAISSLTNSLLIPNDDQQNEQKNENSRELNNVAPIEPSNSNGMSTVTNNDQQEMNTAINHVNNSEANTINETVRSVIDGLIKTTDDLTVEDSKNGRTFLAKLDDEEKVIKSRADAYGKILQSNDSRLDEDVRTDINAVIGEVNLLLKGKLKQFRGLCERNVTKSTASEPIPLDSDLEGFWDITYPLIDKVKEKFAKLDARKAKQWAPVVEYDPNDINNRPRVIDDHLKQLQTHHNKSSKTSMSKSANGDLKKLIQERRKAAATASNQNHDVEIFVAQK